MDAALRPQRWEQQEIGLLKPMEELATFPATVSGAAPARSPVAAEKKARPQKEQARSCPRCNSKHTKFCYYNNYSLSQPRHFCKTCRRYWTDGGSLRNVPVGGGSRKNKRSTITTTDITGRNHEGQVHQNLAVPEYPNQYLTFYNNDSIDHRLLSGMAARDIGSLRFGSSTSTTLPPLEFPSGFDGLTFTPPKLNISADARLLFPFDDLKPEIPSTAAAAAADHQHTSFWNAMIHRSGSSSYQMNS